MIDERTMIEYETLKLHYKIIELKEEEKRLRRLSYETGCDNSALRRVLNKERERMKELVNYYLDFIFEDNFP